MFVCFWKSCASSQKLKEELVWSQIAAGWSIHKGCMTKVYGIRHYNKSAEHLQGTGVFFFTWDSVKALWSSTACMIPNPSKKYNGKCNDLQNTCLCKELLVVTNLEGQWFANVVLLGCATACTNKSSDPIWGLTKSILHKFF